MSDDITVLVDTLNLDVVVETGKTINIQLSGPAGPPGSGGAVEIPFAYGDATPKDLLLVVANKLVYTVSVVIKQAFNGVGAALTIGSSGSPSALMAANENDPTQVGEYETNPSVFYGVNTQLQLFITPGAGASAGSGVVLISVQS